MKQFCFRKDSKWDHWNRKRIVALVKWVIFLYCGYLKAELGFGLNIRFKVYAATEELFRSTKLNYTATNNPMS